MNTSTQSVLFLSGAGLPDWIWDGVRHRLSESYETQVAPRPTGRTAGVRDYASAAIDSIATERFTIVAHSAGGVVGAEVMQQVPARVTRFLGISAIVPRPGGSFITAMPVPNRWMLSLAMRFAGTRPPASAIRKTLARGLDEQTTDRLITDFTPEPQGYYRERIGIRSAEGVKSVERVRGYVTTTDDRELSSALQRRFAANLGANWQHQLPTGHLPMLEDPEALAETITGFLSTRVD